jgi:hypothetical protein
MNDDILFAHIERLQAGMPWGRVLDAGTGRDSLSWIASLETEIWTAITADDPRARRLTKEFRKSSRPNDRVIAGNWTEPSLLHGEVFDVVLADYLVGAIDRFAPYFQYGFFRRLRPHVRDRLYVVGLEPHDESDTTPGGRVILEIARLRDACILHAGHRCHREYPLEWTITQLEDCGFTVEDAKSFPIIYRPKFINGQLDVCVEKLDYIHDPALCKGLRHRIDDLRRRALAVHESLGGIRFGADYVIFARPKS